ncbi:MAG: hypothetical protein U9N58_03005, partial [Thermodesulfobacteriota bacterium]|nr:hypothetical protein [Thermodesulfobacteriota bacterium]
LGCLPNRQMAQQPLFARHVGGKMSVYVCVCRASAASGWQIFILGSCEMPRHERLGKTTSRGKE